MDTKTLVYVGPHDVVEQESLEGHVIERGVPTDFPADVAGEPPVGHPLADPDYDPGWGLLAQPTNWVEYEAAAPSAAPGETVDPARLRKPELKRACEAAGLDSDGNVAELRARLAEHLEKGAAL
jgi:hypothetical protein